MSIGGAQAIVAKGDAADHGIGQEAGPANDAEPVRDAVGDIEINQGNAGNAIGVPVQAKLHGGAPAIAGIVAATADDIALPDGGGAVEDIGAHRERGAEEQAAAVGDVEELAILDAIAGGAVDGAAVGEEGRLAGAMGDEIAAGGEVGGSVGGGPDGKTVVAGAARGAIGYDGALHANTQIDAVGQSVAKPAAVHHEAGGIDDPRAGLGVFHPDAGDGGIGAVVTAQAIVGFGVIAVIQFSHDGEVGQMDVAAMAVEGHPAREVGV